MSNGVDFRKMAVELRGQLTAAEIDLTTWKTKACESAEREAALREELAQYKQAVGEFKLTGDYHVDVNALLVEAVTARSLQTSVEQSLENRTDRVAELADERNKLRHSLASAEQRNAEYERLLNIVLKDYMHSISATMLTLIRAALKPAESGASE